MPWYGWLIVSSLPIAYAAAVVIIVATLHMVARGNCQHAHRHITTLGSGRIGYTAGRRDTSGGETNRRRS